MIAVWKAFYNNRLEVSNKKFFNRIASQRRRKNVKKGVFRELKKYSKLHRGHGPSRFKSLVYSNQKLGTKFLKLWIDLFKTSTQKKNRRKYIKNKMR